MKTLITILSFTLFVSAIPVKKKVFGTNYYFSSTGSDAGAGTIGSPWQTLAKFVATFNAASSGDSIFFKRGDSFYGSVYLRTGGAQYTPIYVGDYGTGAKPLITGMKTVTTWSSLGGNIWEAPLTGTGKAGVQVVTVNGVMYPMGRYPNVSAGNGGYLTYEGHSGAGSITDNELTGSPNWATGNAEIVVRKNHWIIDRSTITGHSTNTITFTATSGYQGTDYFGYFIQQDPRTLDENNEWYPDTVNHKLKIYSTTDPNSKTIRAACIDTLFYMWGKFNVTINNIDFEGSNMYTFRPEICSDLTVTNCGFRFSALNGVNGFTLPNSIWRYNSHDYTGNNAFYVSDAANTLFEYDTVNHTALFPGMGMSSDQARMGALVAGDGSIMRYNVVKNTGYNAMYFNGNNFLVYRNRVDSFCLTSDDGGGIYTSSANGGETDSNRIVRGNIVTNGLGNKWGTYEIENNSTVGIYMDDKASNSTIDSNTIINVSEHGIYVHNAHNHKIRDNIIFDYHKSAIGMTHDILFPLSPIRDVVIKKNVMFSKYSTQNTYFMFTIDNDLAQFLTADSNDYRSASLNINVSGNGGSSYSNFNFADWKSTFVQDASTAYTVVTAPADSISAVVNPSLGVLVTPVSRVLKDLRGISRPVVLSVLPWRGEIVTVTGDKPVVNTTPFIAPRRLRLK